MSRRALIRCHRIFRHRLPLASLLSCNPAPRRATTDLQICRAIHRRRHRTLRRSQAIRCPPDRRFFSARLPARAGSRRRIGSNPGAHRRNDPVDVGVGTPLADGEERAPRPCISAPSTCRPCLCRNCGEANHGLAAAAANPSPEPRPNRLHRCLPSSFSSVTKQLKPTLSFVRFRRRYAGIFQNQLSVGFCQAGASKTAFIVGLPERATADKSSATPRSERRKPHPPPQPFREHHPSSHGIALANGGAASGYAKTTNTHSIETADSSIGFPFCMRLQNNKSPDYDAGSGRMPPARMPHRPVDSRLVRAMRAAVPANGSRARIWSTRFGIKHIARIGRAR